MFPAREALTYEGLLSFNDLRLLSCVTYLSMHGGCCWSTTVAAKLGRAVSV